MANRFQQQSLRRKVIYFLLILALFTVTLYFRRHHIEARASALGMREQNLGEVELTDRALRLSLTGSRGFVICYLWYVAQDKQKRQEWNELDLLVRSMIKLQPHFVTPWLFQSWNLAYNVSVALDRVKDKYFYIAEGIGLLAEGTRENVDNPDMRMYVGIYNQNKFGISDEQQTLRSLFQLSCIDPAERDPARYRRIVDGRPIIDLDRFEEFCRRHPFLVRRLRDKLRCNKPEGVIEFLANSQKIPSRYEDRPAGADEDQPAARYRPLKDRFPLLPPAQRFNPSELTYESDIGDDFDNYACARAWCGYAQDPVLDKEQPRKPHGMAQVVFEQYPARTQCYLADRLEQEGWFDTEGWTIRSWFPRERSRPQGELRLVRVGTDRRWAQEAWERGYEMYKEFGEARGLYKTPAEEAKMMERERIDYDYSRSITNYAHHLSRADVERLPEAVQARKLFFKADELRLSGDRELALETYERPDAFAAWKKILLRHPEFASDQDLQEDTYLMQRKYLSLFRDRRRMTVRRMLLIKDMLTLGTIWFPGVPVFASGWTVGELKEPYRGPFDDFDAHGQPLISERAISSICARYNLAREVGGARPQSVDVPSNVKMRPIAAPRPRAYPDTQGD